MVLYNDHIYNLKIRERNDGRMAIGEEKPDEMVGWYDNSSPLLKRLCVDFKHSTCIKTLIKCLIGD